MRLLGPNCIGLINVPARTALSVNAVLAMAPPLFANARPLVAPRRAVAVVTTTGGAAALVVDRLGLAGIEAAEMRDMTLTGTQCWVRVACSPS